MCFFGDSSRCFAQGFTGLCTENEFWVLSAKGSYSKRRRSFKKGRPKGYGKKGGKRSRPGFRPRSKGKGFAAWEDDQQDTAFWGKGKSKGKGKKGKKGMMKRKDSFKGMPSWKGKGQGDAKNKGGNNPFLSQPPQADVAQWTESFQTAAVCESWPQGLSRHPLAGSSSPPGVLVAQHGRKGLSHFKSQQSQKELLQSADWVPQSIRLLGSYTPAGRFSIRFGGSMSVQLLQAHLLWRWMTSLH